MAKKSYIFDGPKMFTALRHELFQHTDLPASAKAVYVLLHFDCDPDTGEIYRNDSEMSSKTGIPRQTIWVGFKLLEQATLIQRIGHSYFIVNYERYRKSNGSYFRIPKQFHTLLSKCVRHHLPDVILFALQLLDQLRNHGAKPEYSTQTLKKYLGKIYCRLRKKLDYLTDVFKFSYRVNGKGIVYTFSPIVDVLATEEQVKHRNVQGKVARHVKIGLTHNTRGFIVESRRFVNTCVKFILDYCKTKWIDESEMLTLARVVGTQIAMKREQRDPVKFPKAYLARSVDDLYAQL